MARFSRRPRFRRFSRKRRVSQGTWFPTNGTFWIGDNEEYWDASIQDVVGPVPTSHDVGPAVAVYSLTADYTQSALGIQNQQVNARPSLRDFTEGQDWMLKRLVGNLVVQVNPVLGDFNFSISSYWTQVRVGAGFFVARALDEDQSSPDLTGDEIDPLGGKNIQNSWIWRRTWILDNPNAIIPINVGSSVASNLEFEVASNREMDAVNGPHFDTKSKRRIKREERLWFAISAMGVGVTAQTPDVGGLANLQPAASWWLDYRIFGKMMRGKTSATF